MTRTDLDLAGALPMQKVRQRTPSRLGLRSDCDTSTPKASDVTKKDAYEGERKVGRS